MGVFSKLLCVAMQPDVQFRSCVAGQIFGERGEKSSNGPNTVVSRPALTADLVRDKQRGICDSASDPPDKFDLENDGAHTALLSDERYVINIYNVKYASARDGELSRGAREHELRSIRLKTNGFSVWSPVLTPVLLA